MNIRFCDAIGIRDALRPLYDISSRCCFSLKTNALCLQTFTADKILAIVCIVPEPCYERLPLGNIDGNLTNFPTEEQNQKQKQKQIEEKEKEVFGSFDLTKIYKVLKADSQRGDGLWMRTVAQRPKKLINNNDIEDTTLKIDKHIKHNKQDKINLTELQQKKDKDKEKEKEKEKTTSNENAVLGEWLQWAIHRPVLSSLLPLTAAAVLAEVKDNKSRVNQTKRRRQTLASSSSSSLTSSKTIVNGSRRKSSGTDPFGFVSFHTLDSMNTFSASSSSASVLHKENILSTSKLSSRVRLVRLPRVANCDFSKTAVLSLPSNELQSVCGELAIIGTALHVTVNKDHILLSTIGLTGTASYAYANNERSSQDVHQLSFQDNKRNKKTPFVHIPSAARTVERDKEEKIEKKKEETIGYVDEYYSLQLLQFCMQILSPCKHCMLFITPGQPLLMEAENPAGIVYNVHLMANNTPQMTVFPNRKRNLISEIRIESGSRGEERVSHIMLPNTNIINSISTPLLTSNSTITSSLASSLLTSTAHISTPTKIITNESPGSIGSESYGCGLGVDFSKFTADIFRPKGKKTKSVGDDDDSNGEEEEDDEKENKNKNKNPAANKPKKKANSKSKNTNKTEKKKSNTKKPRKQ